jgi:hypothetical protein
MGICCGIKGKIWNRDGQNWCCEFCGKGLTKKELDKMEPKTGAGEKDD